MSKVLQAIRGMNDILPQTIHLWARIESHLRDITSRYGYQEIRLPIVESTALFTRSIGEVTDIVEKEMYTFSDRNGDSLSLRPEGTASCVRACLQHSLLYNQPQRLWYLGPMFRHERPQKGRYRQFHQFGVEAFGFEGPDIDVELIAMTARLWEALGLSDAVSLQLNSLGTRQERLAYREALVIYFESHIDALDSDSQRRLTQNPLRILDSKNPDMQLIIQGAPVLSSYLGEASRRHLQTYCELLDSLKINYTINERLVRGLDYYTHVVFEWVSDALGAQSTVCAGGRYDGLVEQLGGRPTPAVGFALGLERLVLLCEQGAHSANDVYLLAVGEKAAFESQRFIEHCRDVLPSLRFMLHCGGGSFKSQFKRADKSHARIALILGDDEIDQQTIGVKYLREDLPQEVIARQDVENFLRSYFNRG